MPAVVPRSFTEVSEERLIRSEPRVLIVSERPGQPRTVAYRTLFALLRVKRMSCGVPACGVVNEPPPIFVGPSPYVVQARVAYTDSPKRFRWSPMPSRMSFCAWGMVPSAIGAMFSSMLPFLLTRSMHECSICWTL